MAKLKIFISYSHEDKGALDEILPFLRPLKGHLIEWWEDTQIASGERWHLKIEHAMSEATVAILLVSQHFLDSTFIMSHEAPFLVARAVENQLILIPVFLSPCLADKIGFTLPDEGTILLTSFQGHGSLDMPLLEMAEVDRQREWVRLGERLLSLAGQSDTPPPATRHRRPPFALAASLAGLALAFPLGLLSLGFFVMRARESMISIEPLDYPWKELAVTGAGALWSLLWHGVWVVIVPGHEVLGISAITLLLLVILLSALPRLRWLSERARIAVLLASTVLLILGAVFYVIAASANPMNPNSCQRLAGRAERAAVEACTWLENGGQRNDLRRKNFGGLLGWLLLACLAGARVGWQSGSPGQSSLRLYRGLAATHLLVAVLLASRLPSTYASGRWGLRYDLVRIPQNNPRCDQSLAQAIIANKCCVFKVSETATEGMLLVRGNREICPDRGPRRVASVGGVDCIITDDGSETIIRACQ